MEDEDIEMVPVNSSRLSSLGHKGTTLRAEFPNGRVAEYTGVSEETYQAVLSAPSAGSAFHSLIVSGGYPFRYV